MRSEYDAATNNEPSYTRAYNTPVCRTELGGEAATETRLLRDRKTTATLILYGLMVFLSLLLKGLLYVQMALHNKVTQQNQMMAESFTEQLVISALDKCFLVSTLASQRDGRGGGS